MSTILNLKELEKIYKFNNLNTSKTKKNNHNTGPINDILPFTTSGKEIKENFNNLMGEYVRLLCNHKLPVNDSKMHNQNEKHQSLILKLTENIDFSDENKLDLELFLNQYLFNSNSDIKVFHPYMYNFLPSVEEKNYQNYAKFISDVLVQNDKKIINIFKDKESDDILTELILNHLEVITLENEYSKIEKYQCLLPFLSNLYREDLIFISQYKDYFLSNFSLLTHFYTFMYVCQLCFKLEQCQYGDFSYASPFYFSLEWEILSKRRKATEEQGFKMIGDKLSNLFVRIHTFSQLSTHSNDKNQPFLTYQSLNDKIKTAEEKNLFVNNLNDWIPKYSSIFLSNENSYNEELTDFDTAIKALFDTIKKGINSEAATRYGKKVQSLGGKTFLKKRGSLGLVFNMNQEMILLLTTICVKNHKLPLKDLFIEFEKRGVTFDLISKKEIIDLLDSLNILDKKSDSGDAQYVKPIL